MENNKKHKNPFSFLGPTFFFVVLFYSSQPSESSLHFILYHTFGLLKSSTVMCLSDTLPGLRH